MQRERVLQLYKQILRVGRTWQAQDPAETSTEQAYIRSEAQRQFRENKGMSTSTSPSSASASRLSQLHALATRNGNESLTDLFRFYLAGSSLAYQMDWPELTEENLNRVEKVVGSDVKNSFPPKPAFEKKFMKLMVEKLASQNIHSDIIYTQLSAAMCNPSAHFCRIFVHHRLPGALVLRERLQTITHGTTGLSSWEASYLLANYLLQHESPRLAAESTQVLELGAGCGLAGLALAKSHGAVRLIASDCDRNVLDQLNRNVHLNFGGTCNVHVAEIDWLKAEDGEERVPKADLVIAADVVYDPDLLKAFLVTVHKAMQQNAKALIAFKVRNPDTATLFFETLGKLPLRVTEKYCVENSEIGGTLLKSEISEQTKLVHHWIAPPGLLESLVLLELKCC